VTPYFVVKSALSPCFVTASRMSASGHFRPIYRSCLTVHVRFDSKATDWPVVGQLTSFMSTRPKVENPYNLLLCLVILLSDWVRPIGRL
jgi:hypothetical protein